MKKFNYIILATLLAAACNNVVAPETTDTYREMFETSMGSINPDQNWDFYESYYNTVTGFSTKAGEFSFTPDQQAEGVDYSKWQTILKSGEDNRDKGSTDFVLVSGGSFKVYPVWYAGWYPAYTQYNFEMGIIIDGVQTKMFDGLGQDWEPSRDPADYCKNPGTGAIVDIPSGTQFCFYVKYTEYGQTKVLTSETNSILLYANLIDSSKQMMVVGFEDKDKNTWGGSNIPDLNDIVLYIEGNPYLPVVAAKRFMCEDCGSVGDFDFNDLVVDVQVMNSQPSKSTLGVTIQAAGGTRPIYLEIGGQLVGEAHELLGVGTGEMKNTGFGTPVAPYRTTVEIPTQVDIKTFRDVVIRVGGQNSTMYSFPSEGGTPYMIAVPVSTYWMKELKNIKLGYPNFFNDEWMNTTVADYLYVNQ